MRHKAFDFVEKADNVQLVETAIAALDNCRPYRGFNLTERAAQIDVAEACLEELLARLAQGRLC